MKMNLHHINENTHTISSRLDKEDEYDRRTNTFIDIFVLEFYKDEGLVSCASTPNWTVSLISIITVGVIILDEHKLDSTYIIN